MADEEFKRIMKGLNPKHKSGKTIEELEKMCEEYEEKRKKTKEILRILSSEINRWNEKI